jgi:hypothetical protein
MTLQDLQEQCTIDAVVTHYDDRFRGMLFDCKPEHIRGSRYEFLQRLAVRKSHHLR